MSSSSLDRHLVRILAPATLVFVIGCGGGESEPSPVVPEGGAAATPTAVVETVPASITPDDRGTGRLEVMAGSVPFEIVPASIDFGPVLPGSINEGSFTISNRGDKAVRIVRATPSCVCTTLTDLTGVSVPPGGSVQLAASLDAPTVAGEKDAKIFVVLEGMERPAIVKLVGVVTLPVQPTPAYADALKGTTEGVIGLASTDGRPFRVLTSNGNAPMAVGAASNASATSHAMRWSIAGMAPESIPKWWIFTTDREDCPLVACRVRNEATGSKRDPERFTRRWIPKDDFLQLGRVASGDSVDVPVRITHYNPRGGGAIDRLG